MSLKNQRTKSDYLEWDRFQLLLLQLERDREKRFLLLIALGVYTGLRISDVLKLRWNQMLDAEKLIIEEQKTGKKRTIEINENLSRIVSQEYEGQEPEEFIFVNRFGSNAISVQYVNRKLKEIFDFYDIKGNYSSHFMRKTLGRRVWESNNCSDKSLVLLSSLFNHSSTSVTRIYLGIRDEEIQNVYLSL